MKGLLVKDFRLMKQQKNFFLISIAISVGIEAFLNDTTFMVSYFPFVLSLFALSTISYDEFDNGNAFLFTLPVSRTDYTVEKYCLALLLGGVAWFFALVLTVLFGIFKGTASAFDITITALMILPALIVIRSFMIPIQLKFGGDKGRMALIVALGLLLVIGMVLVKVAEIFGVDIVDIINHLSMVRMGVMVIVLVVIAAILLLVSMKVSITIMKNKEF